MKSFKSYIFEEWLDSTNRTGDVWKNPTPREIREYAQSLDAEHDFAGMLVSNDVYLFSGSGLHDDVLPILKKHGAAGKVIRFRGVMDKRGNIGMLQPSGGFVKTKTESERLKLFMDMKEVYDNRYLNKFMDKPLNTLRGIRDMFGYERAYKEFDDLIKQYFK